MTDLPDGYRWAAEEEVSRPDAIVVKLTVDSTGRPYTQDEADVAVPIATGDPDYDETLSNPPSCSCGCGCQPDGDWHWSQQPWCRCVANGCACVTDVHIDPDHIPEVTGDPDYDEAVVDIAQVEPRAERVRADSVKPGDLLFDAYGGTHPVAKVRRFKHTVHITRDDGWPIAPERAELITVIRNPKGA